VEKNDQNPLFTIEKCTQKQYNASSRKTKQSGLKSRNIHFEKRGKRKDVRKASTGERGEREV
jgi:hypothetical protein